MTTLAKTPRGREIEAAVESAAQKLIEIQQEFFREQWTLAREGNATAQSLILAMQDRYNESHTEQ